MLPPLKNCGSLMPQWHPSTLEKLRPPPRYEQLSQNFDRHDCCHHPRKRVIQYSREAGD